MSKSYFAIPIALTIFTVTAGAQPRPSDLKELGERMTLQPLPGRAAAQARRPQWCEFVKAEGSWSPLAIARSIEDPKKTSIDGLLQSAMITCLYPSQPSIHKAVQQIEQMWINWTGLSVERGLETFKYRLAADRFNADKQAICDALRGPAETGGEEAAFAAARREVLGCSTKHAQWIEDSRVNGGLLTYLDSSAIPPDELVRLAWLVPRTRFMHSDRSSDFETALLGYVIDQIDLKALSEPNLLKLLDTAPYKGNTYARAVVLESLARVKTAALGLKAEVDKHVTDADWKELLITAPQRGVADWNNAAEKWKDQLARSNEFEKKFWGPTRSAVHGCWPVLRKDFIEVLKTLKRANPDELTTSLSESVPSLLFSRLAACAAVEQDGLYGTRLTSIAKDLRYSRGPRIAAYSAAFDALGKIKSDRKKFPVPQSEFNLERWTDRSLDTAAADASADAQHKSKIDQMGLVGGDGSGVVKSVKKTAAGVQVTFVTVKHQVMSQRCTETNRVIRIDSSGNLIYARNCVDTGLIWVDDTPDAITVPSGWADGIKVGAMLYFAAARGKPPERIALPTAIYTDKSKAKLVNWNGFGL